MIRKSCTIALVSLLGVFAGYYALLRGRVEFPGDLFLSAFGSIGLLMLLSALKQVIFGEGQVAALERAERGLPLVDGEKEAVWGPIVPVGAPLVSPFSGSPCVAYEYDAKNPSTTDSDGDSSPAGSAISGLALTPSVIRSDRGDVRLLGFSILEKFPARSLRPTCETMDRVLDHVARTRFTETGISKIGSLFSQLDEVLADDDGTVRKDWRMGEADEKTLAACTLEEKVVAPGAMVTAVGIWDASRGGLVPKHGGSSTIVTLAPGGGAAMVVAAKKRPWGLLVFSLIWSGGVHAAIYVVLKTSP